MILPPDIAQRRKLFYLKADSGWTDPRHKVTIGERIVTRVPLAPITREELHLEEEVAFMAWTNGVPAALLMTRGDQLPHHVMAPAEGTNVATLPIEERRVCHLSLGKVLQQLHSIKAYGAGLIIGTDPLRGAFDTWSGYIVAKLDDHLCYASDNQLLWGNRLNDISNAIRGFEPGSVPICLLHGDLNDKNLFARGGQISTIIDWEDAMAGDPLFDVAFWATFHPEEEWHWMLDAYDHNWGVTQEWNERFWVYFLRISLSKLVLLHKEGHRDLARAQGRITRGLAALST